ncbi:MAG: response regulator [Phycisphaerae bacterium]
MRAHGIPLRGLDGATTRVLIVDRDYETADALRVALEASFDYQVQVATGVFEAGMLARQGRPNVILLDTNLPGLKAAELRTALQADPELLATRVVAVDDQPGEHRQQAWLHQGFDGCLPRPYNLAAAVRVIEEATDIVA